VIALNRLSIAFGVYVLLGVLAWTTLDDSRVQAVTFAILALFALKTLLHRKDAMHGGDGETGARH
jgi:Na+/H+ antiporter NhaA